MMLMPTEDDDGEMYAALRCLASAVTAGMRKTTLPLTAFDPGVADVFGTGRLATFPPQAQSKAKSVALRHATIGRVVRRLASITLIDGPCSGGERLRQACLRRCVPRTLSLCEFLAKAYGGTPYPF